jgi:hypothetical protein
VLFTTVVGTNVGVNIGLVTEVVGINVVLVVETTGFVVVGAINPEFTVVVEGIGENIVDGCVIALLVAGIGSTHEIGAVLLKIGVFIIGMVVLVNGIVGVFIVGIVTLVVGIVGVFIVGIVTLVVGIVGVLIIGVVIFGLVIFTFGIDGIVVFTDGRVVFTDGMVVFTDGRVVFKDGSDGDPMLGKPPPITPNPNNKPSVTPIKPRIPHNAQHGALQQEALATGSAYGANFLFTYAVLVYNFLY